MPRSFKISGADVAEVLIEFMKRWGRTMTDDLAGVALDFRLDDFVDALCLNIANNPGLPLDLQRPELRALLGMRVQVLLRGAIAEDEDTFLTSPEKPSLEMLVGAVFGRLLAGARLPAEWNGEAYPHDLVDYSRMRRP